MKRDKPYAELVSQAEQAVASIRDAELRRVAFERVLDDLILVSAGSSPRGKDAPRADVGKRQQPGTALKRKRGGPKAYVRDLAGDGFFKKPKTIAEVKAELANRGHHIALTSLSGPLQALCQERVLRRHKAKAKGKDKKPTYNYSEW